MYIHKKTKENLIISLSDMKHTELDLVIVICGFEGWGKSFMARGIAMFCAMFLGVKFGLDDIYFSLDEYIKGSFEGDKFKINVLDEARKVLFKRRSMSSPVVKFTNYMSECRSKRQVHIILVPSYSDLDRYIVAWRLNMLFAIDKEYLPTDKTESGYTPRFGCYRLFVRKKQLIYAYDKGYNYYPKSYESRDKWTSKDVFSKEEIETYIKKKDEATFKKYIEEESKPKPRATDKYLKRALVWIRNHLGYEHRKIFEAIEMPSTNYFNALKFEEETLLTPTNTQLTI